MARATTDSLDNLHALLAATLQAEVKRYTDHVNEEGKHDPQPIPPALLAQIAKFLKDNGIDSPVRAGQVRDNLKGKLPDLADVEMEHEARYQ